MIVKRFSDVVNTAGWIHTGKIPFQDKEPVMELCGLPADVQLPEKVVEPVGHGHIVVMFQHGKQQRLADARAVSKLPS